MSYGFIYGGIGAWTFAPATWKVKRKCGAVATERCEMGLTGGAARDTVRNWALFLSFVNTCAAVGALLLYWPALDIGWW